MSKSNVIFAEGRFKPSVMQPSQKEIEAFENFTNQARETLKEDLQGQLTKTTFIMPLLADDLYMLAEAVSSSKELSTEELKNIKKSSEERLRIFGKVVGVELSV